MAGTRGYGPLVGLLLGGVHIVCCTSRTARSWSSLRRQHILRFVVQGSGVLLEASVPYRDQSQSARPLS